MRCTTLFFLFFIFSSSVRAQTRQERGYFNITQISYLPGVGQYNLGDVRYKFSGRSYGLNTINGWFLTNKTSIGIGIGLQGIHDPNFNTARLFIDVRQYLYDRKSTFFGHVNAGINPAISNTFTKGAFGELGVGYKIMAGKIGLLASTGYQIQAVKSENYKTTLHSLSVSVGVLF